MIKSFSDPRGDAEAIQFQPFSNRRAAHDAVVSLRSLRGHSPKNGIASRRVSTSSPSGTTSIPRTKPNTIAGTGSSICPERLSIPGFLSAYRYQAIDATPKFFTWYFVRNVEVLRSPAYLERLGNPTEWTTSVMPSFRNMTRCACRLTSDTGRGIGGTVVVVRVSAAAEREREGRGAQLRESAVEAARVGGRRHRHARASLGDRPRDLRSADA